MDRHIREQCAEGEGGAAKRHRAASIRGRSRKKKQEDWIYLGEMPGTGSPGAELEGEATTRRMNDPGKRGRTRRRSGEKTPRQQGRERCPGAAHPTRRMKVWPPPPGVQHVRKSDQRRRRSGKSTLGGNKNRDEKKGDATGLDTPKRDALDRIIRGRRRRSGHLRQERNNQGKGAKGEGGAARRQASTRRRKRRKKIHLVRIIHGVTPLTGSTGGEQEGLATTPAKRSSGKLGPTAKEDGKKTTGGTNEKEVTKEDAIRLDHTWGVAKTRSARAKHEGEATTSGIGTFGE